MQKLDNIETTFDDYNNGASFTVNELTFQLEQKIKYLQKKHENIHAQYNTNNILCIEVAKAQKELDDWLHMTH